MDVAPLRRCTESGLSAPELAFIDRSAGPYQVIISNARVVGPDDFVGKVEFYNLFEKLLQI